MDVFLTQICYPPTRVNIHVLFDVYLESFSILHHMSILTGNCRIFKELIFLDLNVQRNVPDVFSAQLEQTPSADFLLGRPFIFLKFLKLSNYLFQVISLVPFQVQSDHNGVFSRPVLVYSCKDFVDNFFDPLLKDVVHEFSAFCPNLTCGWLNIQFTMTSRMIFWPSRYYRSERIDFFFYFIVLVFWNFHSLFCCIKSIIAPFNQNYSANFINHKIIEKWDKNNQKEMDFETQLICQNQWMTKFRWINFGSLYHHLE